MQIAENEQHIFAGLKIGLRSARNTNVSLKMAERIYSRDDALWLNILSPFLVYKLEI